MLKLKAACFLSVFALAACGGGKSGNANDSKPDESRTEIEVKYNLPPAPDAELAKTEIVDTNNDGLRDEVERALTLKYHENENVVTLLKETAKLVQYSSENPDDENQVVQNYQKIGLLIACLQQKKSEDSAVEDMLNDVEAMIADTSSREQAKEQADALISGGVYVLPPRSERQKYCSEMTK